MAIEVVFERGHIPIALERFSPTNDSDLAVIRKAIGSCQIYLLILGHRYGELVPGRNISFTELEYEIAEEYNLHIVTFILADEEMKERRSKLDPEKDSKEISNYERLLAFHKRLQTRFRQYWRPGDRFQYHLANALNDNAARCKNPGFIREDAGLTLELFRTASKNEFIVDIVHVLRGFDRLFQRASHNSDSKREIARCFRQRYLDRLIRHRVTLFFESGSTLVYLAKELAPRLSETVRLDEANAPNIQICTNNVLAYLLLWLRARVPCTLFPWSPPGEESYGASYGGLESIESLDPDYSQSPLNDIAKAEIVRLKRLPFTPTSFHRPALLLGSASGIQIGPIHRCSFPEGMPEPVQQDYQRKIDQCYGPHVGSYHNKIFKRFLYDTRLPVIFFLTTDKIDCIINVTSSHFILDSVYPWDAFVRTHPVAFCVASPAKDQGTYQKRFEALGCSVIEGSSRSSTGVFIARSQAFIDEFENTINAVAT